MEQEHKAVLVLRQENNKKKKHTEKAHMFLNCYLLIFITILMASLRVSKGCFTVLLCNVSLLASC